MTALSVALVLVAALGVYALRLFLAARYPAPAKEDAAPLMAEIEKLKSRVETLELQRGILRNAKGTKP